jgi:hypothetical protein
MTSGLPSTGQLHQSLPRWLFALNIAFIGPQSTTTANEQSINVPRLYPKGYFFAVNQSQISMECCSLRET